MMRCRSDLLYAFLMVWAGGFCLRADTPFLSLKQMPDYTFLSWKNKVVLGEQGLEVKAPNAKGGMGFHHKADLTAHRDQVLQLRLTHPALKSPRTLSLQVLDQDDTQTVFRFELPAGKEPNTVSILEKDRYRLGDGGAVKKPGEDGRLNLDRITRVQLVGDWRNQPIAFTLHSLVLVPDTADSKQRRKEAEILRQQNEQQTRQKAQARRARRERILKQGAGHPPDGARIESVTLAAPSLVHLTLVEFEWRKGEYRPFQPDEEVILKPHGKKVLAREHGSVVTAPKDRRVFKNGVQIGLWLKAQGLIREADQLTGTPLLRDMLQEPRAFSLFRSDAPDQPFHPVAVHRKSRPIDGPLQREGKQIRHQLFLELPEPLSPGDALRIVFHGVNTRVSETRLAFTPEHNRTEALQVSQVGYRPDDPFKQAALSLWRGTGGAHDFDGFIGKPFYLLDSDGNRYPGGRIRKRMGVEDIQASFRAKRNHAGTHLYELDFSTFSRPGIYRIYVEGLGTSLPFPIQEHAWRDAFRISMMGFLHHRSGIVLGPPFTPYQRPLSFHPDAGLIPLQTDVMRVEGESDVIHASLSRLHESASPVPEAWGGYMDAGDWDRRSQHLEASFLHLELLELFPEVFATLRLNLPEAEQQNTLPDLLDEALWNIDCYARLQLPHGGVRGGIESTEHPRGGEASWHESLLVGVFAPDPVSSYLFTTTALKASRLLKRYDPERAQNLRQAGLSAWRWAEQYDVTAWTDKQRKAHRRERTLAAIQAYAVTGETGFLNVFRKTSHLTRGRREGLIEDQHALFVAATLPDRPASRDLQQQAETALLGLADRAIQFQQGNAFHRATPVYGLPMMGYVGYFSVPEMISVLLPRAHALTGKTKYLQAAVAACNFPNGVNPNNMVYTTGVGVRSPRNPLHIDSRQSGQPPPAGITVYGQSDPKAGFAFNEWVHDWQLKDAMPPSREWPTAEAYFDVFLWPGQSEYTVQQTIGPTSYYWGYLAGRPIIAE